MTVFFGLLLSLSAAAGGVVTLTPGSEITLSPQETTTVRCQGQSNQESFCRCSYTPRLGNYLERLTLVKGQWQQIFLGQYSSAQGCRDDLPSHPACRS